MSGAETSGTRIEKKSDLIDYIAEGAKPKDEWRIGTEHEKFGFRQGDFSPLPYEGPHGIKAMLEGMQRFGWRPVEDGGHLIALEMDGQSVTLEPGGQFELSGGILRTLHETCAEVNTHLDQVRQVADEIGVGFLGLGFQPKWRLDQIPVMPKGRYGIMRNYMPKRGRHGLDMMFRSCTVQVNLDFASEADMVKKLRVGLALQPIATALFANSPFVEGKPSGFLSMRSQVWLDTDPDRTGMLPRAFEQGFGFESYVDWALDVPMYFVYRDGRYIDASGQSFRDFMAGRLPALPGETPTSADWSNHLTTLFPEARVKRWIEMRGADGGPWRRLCALPALWVGLLYDQGALDAAWDLCKDWTEEERDALRRGVPKTALATPFRNTDVRGLAGRVLEIAEAGLKARAENDLFGGDESHFLNTLKYIVESGRTPAEDLLALYHGRWGGSVDPVFDEFAY